MITAISDAPHGGKDIEFNDGACFRLGKDAFAALTGGSDRILPSSTAQRRGLRHLRPTTAKNRAIVDALRNGDFIDAERAFTERGFAVRSALGLGR